MPGVNTVLLSYELQQSMQWAAVFPFVLASHFFISHFGINLLKMKLCINMLQTHLNFNGMLVFLFGNGIPCRNVATTDTFQQSILWFELNECISKWPTHKQTPQMHTIMSTHIKYE